MFTSLYWYCESGCDLYAIKVHYPKLARLISLLLKTLIQTSSFWLIAIIVLVHLLLVETPLHPLLRKSILRALHYFLRLLNVSLNRFVQFVHRKHAIYTSFVWAELRGSTFMMSTRIWLAIGASVVVVGTSIGTVGGTWGWGSWHGVMARQGCTTVVGVGGPGGITASLLVRGSPWLGVVVGGGPGEHLVLGDRYRVGSG